MDAIGLLLGKKSFTIVDASDVLGPEILKDLKVARVTIKFTSEPMRHQLEDGSTEIDTRIIRPARAQVDVICDTVESLTKVNELLLDRVTIYNITSRGILLSNMKVNTEILQQSPKMISATPIRIEFKQLLVENFSPVIFQAASDSSIVQRGIDAVTDVTDKFAAAAGNIVKTASGLADKVKSIM